MTRVLFNSNISNLLISTSIIKSWFKKDKINGNYNGIVENHNNSLRIGY